MITIGVDAHKSLHVACALDEGGRVLAHWEGENSPSGWHQFQSWCHKLAPEAQVGIEGAGSYGRGLAQFLGAQDVVVYDINPRWSAGQRQHNRRTHKSDRHDALAVARLVYQEAPDLPRVVHDQQVRVLQLLNAEYDDLKAEATRSRNQLHALLLEAEPTYRQRFASLTSPATIARLCDYEPLQQTLVSRACAQSIRRRAARLRDLLAEAERLSDQLRRLAMQQYAPLTELCGVGPLSAAQLAAHLGGGPRFGNDAQLAAYAGVAPLEASSAAVKRHRLNRQGNRQLNAIFYRISLTQRRYLPQAQAYMAKKQAEGKSPKEAVRCHLRYIARAVFRCWQACFPLPQPAAATARAIPPCT